MIKNIEAGLHLEMQKSAGFFTVFQPFPHAARPRYLPELICATPFRLCFLPCSRDAELRGFRAGGERLDLP
jgi:hypothetical protein